MVELILLGAVVCSASGISALLFSRRPTLAARATTLLMAVGAVVGIVGSVAALFGTPSRLNLGWAVPGAALHLRADALSGFFAVPIFILGFAGTLYGERYWPTTKPRGRYVRVFYGLTVFGLVLCLIAWQMMVFLVAWEIIAVTAYFLVATEGERSDTRDAAWLYLAASHVSVLCLFALFSLLHSLTGSWDFAPIGHQILITPAGRAIFWLAISGFLIKAGAMPFHVWLPGAHAAAPSHVSALMSGAVIKIGIYGLVRVLSLLTGPPAWFGGVIIVFGIVSSIGGVVFALAQHDLKRLLAYHSIENIGIILVGIGVGLLGSATGRPVIAILGFGGAFLHVWNHSLFKGLLFLGAGAVIYSTHTREIDRLGGIGRRMPWSMGTFLVGAVAISGLPPLNGFVSEWLLYVASFSAVKGSDGWPPLLLMMVAPALALTGALAVACFVKAFGAVFLGHPRSDAAAAASEAPWTMRFAMLPLAAACVVIGVAPTLLVPLLTRALAPLIVVPGEFPVSLAPLQLAAVIVVAGVLVATLAVRFVVRSASTGVTWDCGYAAPSPRMQYTASSFARALTGFFDRILRPSILMPSRLSLFPVSGSFESHTPDNVLDGLLLPILRRTAWVLSFVRYLQRGRLQMYLVYIGAALVLMLAWSFR